MQELGLRIGENASHAAEKADTVRVEKSEVKDQEATKEARISRKEAAAKRARLESATHMYGAGKH